MIITQGTTDFNIPDGIMGEYVRLILNTESLTDEEKQYFFDIYKTQTRQERGRMCEILHKEEAALQELEAAYI